MKNNKELKCQYCNKYFPEDIIIIEEIYRNNKLKKYPFCSKKHANYYQMGCE